MTEMANLLSADPDQLVIVFDCSLQWGSRTHQNNCRWKLKGCLQSEDDMKRLVVYTFLDTLKILQRRVGDFLLDLVKSHSKSRIGLIVIDNVQQYDWQSSEVQEEIYRMCIRLSEKYLLLRSTNFVVLRRR